jgi:hypothetical protein
MASTPPTTSACFATTRSRPPAQIPQPLLLLQGDREYQATVANDLDVWLKDLTKPAHVDPNLIATIAAWIDNIRS